MAEVKAEVQAELQSVYSVQVFNLKFSSGLSLEVQFRHLKLKTLNFSSGWTENLYKHFSTTLVKTKLHMALFRTIMYTDSYKSYGNTSNSSFTWYFRSTDCQKVLGKKCWDGRLQHFWPKVLESSIPTLLPNTFSVRVFFDYLRCLAVATQVRFSLVTYISVDRARLNGTARYGTI